MTELNKVDILVKANMLRYSGIFPSRMDVLSHIFMVNGSGYYFDASKGIVTNGEEITVPSKMIRRVVDNFDSLSDASKLRIEYENHMQDFIEANIDRLCRQNISSMTASQDPHSLSLTFYKERGLMSQIEKYLDEGHDPESIDDDWRRALKEFCGWFRHRCTSEMYVDSSGEEPTSHFLQILPAYNMCGRLIEKTRTEEDKRFMAERSEIARKIMQGIKQKEKK